MENQQLWAPWRLGYIKDARKERDTGCFLCRYRDETRDAENLVVARMQHSMVVMNRFPYNNGHLLVAPLAHKADFDALDDDELCDVTRAVKRMTSVLQSVLHADGFNVGINLGKEAGAGVPGHLHWHIVPRWSGDTNFMPVLAGIKVIPQSLEALYGLLRQELERAAE